MICQFLVDDNPCGKDPVKTWNVPLCPEHSIKMNSTLRSGILTLCKFYSPEEFPGFCYIAVLGDGLIKIGFSSTERTLRDRIRKLVRETGSCKTLRILSGGPITEAVLHDRFMELRVWAESERFSPNLDLLEFALSDEPPWIPTHSK